MGGLTLETAGRRWGPGVGRINDVRVNLGCLSGNLSVTNSYTPLYILPYVQ